MPDIEVVTMFLMIDRFGNLICPSCWW